MTRPKIIIMGEEVPWEAFPEASAVALEDHFKPVKLSRKAIDEASKIVPSEHWIKYGIYSWLSARANHVFSKLPSTDATVGRLGSMKYKFEFDADGPVLVTVFLV